MHEYGNTRDWSSVDGSREDMLLSGGRQDRLMTLDGLDVLLGHGEARPRWHQSQWRYLCFNEEVRR